MDARAIDAHFDYSIISEDEGDFSRRQTAQAGYAPDIVITKSLMRI
jgi:hypothetical protein